MAKKYGTQVDAIAQQIVAAKRANGGSLDIDEIVRRAKELWKQEAGQS